MVKLRILPPDGTTSIAPATDVDTAPLLPITATWRLDVAGQRLVGPSGEVLLPALEFRLLEVFRHHPHRVLSREQLLDAVWGRDFAGTDRVVDRAVCWLRRILEPDPAHPRALITRRGVGYSYCPPPPAS
jgi:two-component system OmpR family response regulator